MFEHLEEVFREYKLVYKYYLRADITYYNESEPDPVKLQQSKAEGEKQRDRIDKFYLGLALARRENLINLNQMREILTEALPVLDFTNLVDIFFTGDATYLAFENMFVQIRKSGTDAKLRGYVNGDDKSKCEKYLQPLVNYSGELTTLYEKYISGDFRHTLYGKKKKIYEDYLYQGL